MTNAPSRRRPVAFLLCVVLGVMFARPPIRGQDAQQPTDAQIYQHFRTWVTSDAADVPRGPAATQADVMRAYRNILARDGIPGAEIARRVKVIEESGQRLEIDLWNRVLTAEKPTFNVKPNAFLVRATKDIKPGTALDYGMGQGRNAIYLAQQGWSVTGFDPAEKAVALAEEQARRLGVKLTTSTLGDEQFDFGTERWDLIVLSYVAFRATLPKIRQSLKTGGFVVVEAFHRDSLKSGPIGGGVLWDSNELLDVFKAFRVIQYEDAADAADFGRGTVRVVRLLAQKP